MKKALIAFVALAMGLSANAMAVSWKYTATKNDVGQSVYTILGATALTDWASEAAVATASSALGSGASADVAKAGTKYTAVGSAVNIPNKSSSYYFVLVSTDGKQFAVSTPTTAGIYDPDNQESGTQQQLTSASFGSFQSFGGGGGDTPEPTSGLLLLLGVAGLALKRKLV